jgi:hypothetical protein
VEDHVVQVVANDDVGEVIEDAIENVSTFHAATRAGCCRLRPQVGGKGHAREARGGGTLKHAYRGRSCKTAGPRVG